MAYSHTIFCFFMDDLIQFYTQNSNSIYRVPPQSAIFYSLFRKMSALSPRMSAQFSDVPPISHFLLPIQKVVRPFTRDVPSIDNYLPRIPNLDNKKREGSIASRFKSSPTALIGQIVLLLLKYLSHAHQINQNADSHLAYQSTRVSVRNVFPIRPVFQCQRILPLLRFYIPEIAHRTNNGLEKQFPPTNCFFPAH